MLKTGKAPAVANGVTWVINLISSADRKSIEAKIIVPDQFARREERIVHAAQVDREVFAGRAADLITHKRAVEPDVVFTEIAALPAVCRAERLVGGSGGVGLARGDSQSEREAILQIHLRAEADADTKTFPILIHVELR